MKLNNVKAELFIPSGADEKQALASTTHLCIAAHQDDIELMAAPQIVQCYDDEYKNFCGVVVNDGARSPRLGAYLNYTNDQMAEARAIEQKKAACIGKYCAQFLLAYSFAAFEQKPNKAMVEELTRIITATSPQIILTHNPADKHPTHVAVALATIAAIRALPKDKRPTALYGMEVWRGLDWLCEVDKVVFDSSNNQELQQQLMSVFETQVAGGKRYDLAIMGRRLANATFLEALSIDMYKSAAYALDLTPLIENDALTPRQFITACLDRFKASVMENL